MSRFLRILSVAAIAVVAALPAFAADECPNPGPAPAVPDGTTANVDQMKAAHEAVQKYVNLLQQVQDCTEARIKIAAKGTKADVLQKLRDQGNAAIDQAKALQDAYSAAVKAYKSRTAK